jgi:hypothetical protein
MEYFSDIMQCQLREGDKVRKGNRAEVKAKKCQITWKVC